ncbi:MAG: DNA polymerase III subunit gamma/tau [Hyphomicrobiales bacterium]|nr:DNA polymerase III subunit gamma/tau [Hyphomicrobiales bacterium]
MTDSDAAAPGKSAKAPYQVLARKYRPADFDALIGQEAMVRTLTNAIDSGRLAHAFILTGVRGVGKTTTARIIARALNCVGPDGAGGPTPAPCGVCEHCRAIAEDRHVDVMEMDAASRTGVDDIRELIDGVRYRPTSARFKVYIIDEVHMLSRNAFNALLKTLEEPPEHVKFIFATTEIRKVPVTVLSRCQRFDLRRIDLAVLAAHFRKVTDAEGADVSDGALNLIARAADGSVRDGLSLLDQAIAHAAGQVTEDQVRDMLGLADRTRTFDLLDAVMGGDPAAALDMVAEQYTAGADPAVVLEDMLELTHWLTRIKVVPAAAARAGVPEAESVRGAAMAGKLPMAALTRAWQMLLKGLGECRQAPSPLQAAEMVLIRLAYAADLPTPEEALKALGDGGGGTATTAPAARPAAPAARRPGPRREQRPGRRCRPPSRRRCPAAPATTPTTAPAGDRPRAALAAPAREPMQDMAPPMEAEAAPAMEPWEDVPPWDEEAAPAEAAPLSDPASFADVVALAEDRREAILHANLFNNVHLVRFEPGKIEFHPADHAPDSLAHDLSRFLNAHTARRWMVTVSREPGQPTLHQQRDAREAEVRARAARHPLVRGVLDAFPGAVVERVAPREDDGDA